MLRSSVKPIGYFAHLLILAQPRGLQAFSVRCVKHLVVRIRISLIRSTKPALGARATPSAKYGQAFLNPMRPCYDTFRPNLRRVCYTRMPFPGLGPSRQRQTAVATPYARDHVE